MPAMERERSCCRGENVIKYPSSWENALASAGLGNGFIPVLPQGVGTEFTDTAGRGHTPGWLLSAFVRFTFYRVTLIRPSVRTGAPSLWKGEGWSGGPVCRPYGVYRSRPSFFVGAGHWPARRCTRRAESWPRPVSLALAGQFTFSRSTGCRDLHGRPHGAPTEGGRKFPKRAADSRPYKVGGNLSPHPPRIRSAPSPQGEGFRATARVAPTAYPAPVPLVR